MLLIITGSNGLLGQKIIKATNDKYPNADIIEVFDKVKYISGVACAPCTRELKKEARYQFEKKNKIDWHVLGFTIDEWERQKRFNNK
jgi:dTDP-D-glucose 4,6-dehydratase